MRLTVENRARTETRIRAAIDRLLRGDLPGNGNCDIKTLAAEAGITRSALYTTYQHLKIEFEQRRQRQLDTADQPDHRDARIDDLSQQIAQLTTRLTAARHAANDHAAFKIQAVSQIAAQHDELERLRRQLAGPSPVRQLRRPHTGKLIGPC